jgi:hypothetical protein
MPMRRLDMRVPILVVALLASPSLVQADAAALMAPGMALAQPTLLSGTIGKAPVMMSLSNDKGRLFGWYVYLRAGKMIELTGAQTADGAYRHDEFPLDQTKPKKTGVFTGTVAHGHWTGTWRKPEGGPGVSVDLSENHATLADASMNLQCSATLTGKTSGGTYRYSLALAMADGTPRTFSLAQQSTAGGDGCAIDLKDLKPVKSRAGLLLQTDDLAEDKSPRCTIRLVGIGDYLYVLVGDAMSAHNDCRGGEEVAYCGIRQDWADMIVDRKTSTCRPVK